MRGQLTELMRQAGPIASVYIGLDPLDLPIRWRSLETSLLAQGAPPSTVELLNGFLQGFQRGSRQELIVFAAGDRLLWHLDKPGIVRLDRAEFGTPPLVLPLIDWMSRRPPYVEIVMDRLGAEVTSVASGAVAGSTITVTGPDDDLTRGGPRHWDHPRIERRATSSLQHNAQAVAAAATDALKKVDADLLLVAGQPRVVKAMLEHLPKGRPVQARLLPGGRSPDGSAPARQDAVQRLVAQYVTETSLWSEQELSVIGTTDTLLALAAGRVQRLFIVDDAADERVAWFGPGLLCSDSPGEGLSQGRLANVAVRAALLTDADIRVVERDRLGAEGIGALCRFG